MGKKAQNIGKSQKKSGMLDCSTLSRTPGICHVSTFIFRDCLVGLNLFMVELLGLNLFIVFTTLAPGARLARPGTNTGHRRIEWPPPPQLRYRHQHQTRWRPRVTLHDIASSHATDNCSLAGLGLDTGVFTLAWSRY